MIARPGTHNSSFLWRPWITMHIHVVDWEGCLSVPSKLDTTAQQQDNLKLHLVQSNGIPPILATVGYSWLTLSLVSNALLISLLLMRACTVDSGIKHKIQRFAIRRKACEKSGF
jgi:hypothetical protein